MTELRSTDLPRLRRRTLLGAAAGLPLLAAPAVLSRPARAAGQVVVRTPGGSYEEAMVKAVYEPFTKETGIEVLKVPATAGRLLAMFRSGNIELDVIDAGLSPIVSLGRMGALAPIAYDKWRHTNPNDIDAQVRKPQSVGSIYFSSVLGYNTRTFPVSNHPTSWKEFWDLQKFPGPRSLADMATGSPDLEFALLADGVAKNRIYPIDVDRAFKSLDHVRPSIRKFWDTGALSAQMLADGEVAATSIWNGRLQTARNAGAPLAIEWNEAMLQVQAFAVFKGARNLANAQLLIDFALTPEHQAEFAKHIPYGPCNSKAFAHIPASLAAELPSKPDYLAKAFVQDVDWWEDNRDAVSRRWSQWLLRRG